MSNKLLERVGEKLAELGTTVADVVVDKLVEVEVNLRVDAITKAINLLDNLEKGFKRIERPDNKFYDAEGKEILTTSEKRKQEQDKGKENIEKLSNAINLALDTNTTDSYKKLKEVYDKLANNQGNSKPENQ